LHLEGCVPGNSRESFANHNEVENGWQNQYP
jgi:hypothetical protein